jgi:hypothetical protein
MTSADLFVDQMVTWVYSTLLKYGLVGFYWASWAAEGAVGFLRKSVKGVIHAHMEDMWVFVERNAIPWPTKQASKNKKELAFYPDRMTFMTQDHATAEESKNERKSKIDDIVLATLLYRDGMLDLSEFFHEVRWVPSDSAPSPLELIACALLMRHELHSVESIKGYTLDVFTADGEEKRIRLSSSWALRPFEGWPPGSEDSAESPEVGT